MKKFKLFLFTLLSVMIVGITHVNAANVGSADELIECIKNSGTCTLTENIELNERFVIETNKTVVLDLNGKTLDVKLIMEGNWPVFVKGDLTIQGNGTMNITNELGIAVYNGNLTVKNGTFNQASGSYIISNWGTTVIENGTFNGGYSIVNGLDGTTTIKNGNFNTLPKDVYESEDGVLYHWAVLGEVRVLGGTFNQILNWPGLLTEESEVTYRLDSDNNLYSSVEIIGKVNLDLNGYNVRIADEYVEYADDNVFTVMRGGKLTISDSRETGKITTGNNSGIYSAIKMTQIGESATGDVAELVVNGGTIEGYYFGIVGNGGRHNTKITINSGTVKGICAGDNYGIFHPQNGELTVNGGAIEGVTGIEMRAGKLVINDGNVKGNGTLTVRPNGSGTTVWAVGVAISQHTTSLNVDVTINGGTIEGTYAVYQVNPQELGENGYSKVTINLTGGTYKVLNQETDVVYSENERVAITGGSYDKDITDYLATGYTVKEQSGKYVVYKVYTVTLGGVTAGNVEVSKNTAVKGDEITLTLVPNEGYEVGTIKVVDANNNEVAVTNGKFIMPDSNVTVTVTFNEIKQTTEIPVVGENTNIGVKDPAKTEDVLLETLDGITDETVKEKLESSSVKVDVEIEDVVVTDEVKEDFESALEEDKEVKDAKLVHYFDIIIAVKNAVTDAEITKLSELTKPIELMVAMPELEEVKTGYTRNYYIVREHNGEITIIKDVEVSEDGKYLVFESKEFSTYALAYNDVLAEKVPETGDNVITFVVLGFLSIGAIALALNNLKKRELTR